MGVTTICDEQTSRYTRIQSDSYSIIMYDHFLSKYIPESFFIQQYIEKTVNYEILLLTYQSSQINYLSFFFDLLKNGTILKTYT